MRTCWTWVLAAALGGGGLPVGEAGALPDHNVLGDLARAGRALFEQGKLEAALEKFQELLKLDENNRLGNHYLARIQARLGSYRPAIDTLRKLQRLGVPLRHQDMTETLKLVMEGVQGAKDLKERGDLLIHLRETIVGLPLEVEQEIDAHLMAIYAKLGENHLHDIVKNRFFANKPISGRVYFLAARTYLVYDVNLAQAASYFEQAVEGIRGQGIPTTGNPERDRLLARNRDSEAAVAEDFLAYTYHAAKITDPAKNRFIASEQNPKTTFADVTEAAGLGGMLSPRVAVGDFDNDGFEDLCACGRVFRNMGGKAFKEVTAEAKIDPAGVAAALWFDYDGDGRLDLLCGAFPKARLWRNRGDGTFADATAEANLDYAFPGPPEALAVCDYDGDGHLDLFVGCFEHPGRPSLGQPAFLFHNTGKGRFEDVSTASGIAARGKFCTRGAAWGDFNNDGRPDLYVANYHLQPNQLWANQGGGRFTDEAETLGVQGIPGAGRFALAFGHSMGPTWGDLNNDGSLDLGVANRSIAQLLEFADPTFLYRNGGKGDGWRFQDILPGSGIRWQEMSAEMGFCDVDNDGDLDVLLTAIYKERPVALYQNVGSDKFQPITWRSGLIAFNAWGQAWFDKDNDGDMDVALGSANGLRLFENRASDTSWLRVRLAGRGGNRQGIGARVTVRAGALTLIREVACGSGSTSQSSPIAHFGLGSHKGTADIAVRWREGQEQSLSGSPINQLVTIEEK
ncbi:MAG: hypothetical protein FJ290_30600 [Planctomycetes bacterium]|nr:hypothetical protein [Planctomycetota bacterium]